MSTRRYLPQIPSQSTATLTNDYSQLGSHSAIEDLFQIFENNADFITRGKRLLNKKRKLEQLRAQLNLPEDLTNEDTVKLLQLRERLKAKRRLPNVFPEPEKPSMNKDLTTTINRKSSTSMPDLTPTPLADTTNQSSLFDLNASLNSSVYRKRRRKLLFRVNNDYLSWWKFNIPHIMLQFPLSLVKQVGPEFVIQSDSKAEKITVPSRNPFECICQVVILLPNNNRVQLSCKSNATVRIIYETIVTYADLIEHDLFGLTILIDGEYFFPAMDLKISKLINDSKWKTGQTTFVMQLKIKYFVNDIALLRHFLTQHFFYLQFRQMILADTFQTTSEQKLSFATLAYQAEYGDSIDNEKLSTDFIVEHYASNELINQYGIPNLRQEIIKRQHFYAELNDVQAEQLFIENVMKLENYGYHMYKLYKDLKRDDTYLVGIRLRDISIWQLKNRQRQTKLTYAWDQIERIAYDKKSFSIILKRQINEGKIKYLTNNSKKGKHLFNLCYDTYTYTKSLLLRHNSRYSLLNEPIGEIDFVRNGSDTESVDLNPDQSRSQSHENLSTLGKNTTTNSPSIVVYEVDLYKDSNNSFGMSLMGDLASGIFIKSIQPTDGSAARSGKIQTGDRLLSYNGKSINGMTIQEVAEALSLSPNPCRLKLSRHEVPTLNRRNYLQRPMSVDADSFLQQKKQNKNPSNTTETTWSHENFSNVLPSKRVLSNESILTQASDLSTTHDIKSAVFPVTIDKSGHNSLGFLVVGGLDSEIEDHGIYVKSITSGGAAARSKLLIEGDKILEVNGASLARVTHSEAVELFRRAIGPKCHLLVQRLIFPSNLRSSSINKIYPFVHSENTFEVYLNRGPNGLGLSLSGGAAENKPVEMIDIYPNQPAALSGQLNIGDIVLSINDVLMHNRNVRDVPSIIAESPDNVKLVVCRPDRREYQAYLDRQMNSFNQSSRPTRSGSINNEQTRSSNDPLRDLPPKSPGSRRVMSKVPPKVKRGEVFAVIMNKEKDSGFGFTLSAGSTSIGYPHIRSVLREPALSAGLKHWDRILAINDSDCQTITHRDLVARLRYAPTGPVHFIIYRPRIDEIVHAKEKSRQLQNTSYGSISVGQYEKIEISLPKSPQGTYGIGLSQIDPQQPLGGIFICALQPNGIAEKDERLKIDDRLLYVNDRNTDQMTYREVVEALKASTKKGVKLVIARPITDSSTSNKPNIISNKEISTTHEEASIPTSTPPFIASSVMEKLIPREKPKLLPLITPEKPQAVAATTPVSPDFIDISTSSSSSTGAVVASAAAPPSLPPGSALQALIGKKIKPLPSTSFETMTNKNQSHNDKKKDSPVSNTDIDEDTSDIKTPLISPQSPTAPLPTVLELKVPPTNSKSLSTSQANEIAKQKQYYQVTASNETLILNAGITEKIENLTMQLIDKISTPAITMDTTTLMDECREIEMKIDSDEYLEEFRALKTINEHEPIELTSIAMQPGNKTLNRFQNIVPYDFNRVILSTKPDYINASHIAIPFGDKSMKYIICPPPVPESINDFWQMIAERRIQSIIGIFNEQDLKKMKCPIYWPTTIKATMTLSPFLSVTLIKHRQFDGGIDIKEFHIRISEQSHQKHEHSVMFLTYTNWPMDDNIPHDTQSFLNLIYLAHSYQTSDTPLLIHCNTGVGRTGCALLISLLLIKIIRGRTLDIYSMAKECRHQRCGVIQTEQQYRFIYDCARDVLNMAIERSIMQNA
ncbi:unnamed protein product [Rotaria sp. Silwood2]|nr:unnamed protein product [Rotaria sp. Silwood2]CAF2474370.1 unnamed protein product [Rotaria sp. Silwood2]CAF2709674.1 unnamed protein product [Rotaria sp. Silwood2]CAF3902517.1 unnamed protein product [Rotaria sp. Silwood2]CAF4038204.1 unnamed protein product [Rotaria sp. Silwood2]